MPLALWGAVAGVFGFPGFDKHIDRLAWASPLLLLSQFRAARSVLALVAASTAIQNGLAWFFPVTLLVLAVQLPPPSGLSQLPEPVGVRLEMGLLSILVTASIVFQFHSLSVGLVTAGIGLASVVAAERAQTRLVLALLTGIGRLYGSPDDESFALLLVLIAGNLPSTGLIAGLALLWEASDLRAL